MLEVADKVKIRVIEEKDELKTKVDKLQLFLKTSEFNLLSVQHRFLLEKQLSYMQDYLTILEKRIELFSQS